MLNGQGMFFGILFLDDKQPARMSYELNYESVDQDVNSFVIANGLNKEEFRYLILSYTGYGFGLNVLNRVSKIGILS